MRDGIALLLILQAVVYFVLNDFVVHETAQVRRDTEEQLASCNAHMKQMKSELSRLRDNVKKLTDDFNKDFSEILECDPIVLGCEDRGGKHGSRSSQ